jgi:DNA transformation protein
MSGFTDHLHEVFGAFGPIELRRMFGGHGVWHQGLMIGLVFGDTLYIKVDDHTRGQFEAQGLGPFEYSRQGKTVVLSYYRAPEEMLESPAEAVAWARLAYAAALRGVRPASASRQPRQLKTRRTR